MKPTKITQPKHYIELPIFDGSIPSEISADYILPDTYPDVKKLLRVNARPVLIGRYISGKRLEFSGAVDYTVIFSADTDGGESLQCVHFAGEWNNAIGEVDSLDSSDISIVPRITSCSARLSNPRKLSIRSAVATDVKIMGMICCDPHIEGVSLSAEQQLEKLCQTVNSRQIYTFVAEPFRLSEDIETDASAPVIDEIVSGTARIHISEAKPRFDGGSSAIMLKGTVFVDCLYKAMSDQQSYRSFSRKLPLTYTVNAEDCASHFENCLPDSVCARVAAVPTEINVSVGEDSYGERRIIQLDLTAEMTVSAYCAREVPLTLDAYTLQNRSECTFSDLDTSLLPKLVMSNFSVGESIKRDMSAFPEDINIVDVTADVQADTLTVDRGKAILNGKADISCILSDGSGSYTSTETTVPIRFETSIGELCEPCTFLANMTAYDVRMRLDSDQVYFDFEVSLCLDICEKRRHRAINTINISDEPLRRTDNGMLTVCYPTPSDTLWDIAKRYGISKAALEAANQNSKRVLIIPQNNVHSFVV